MYTKTKTRYEIVEAATGVEFQTRLNSTLDRLDADGKNYDVQLLAGFVAYITVKEDTRVAETLADEFHLHGEKHYCAERPFFSKPDDKRVKRGRCHAKDKTAWTDSPCCDRYYEELLKGGESIEE